MTIVNTFICDICKSEMDFIKERNQCLANGGMIPSDTVLGYCKIKHFHFECASTLKNNIDLIVKESK